VVGGFRLIVLEEFLGLAVAFIPYRCYGGAGEDAVCGGGGCAEAAIGTCLDGGVVRGAGIRLVENVEEEPYCCGGRFVTEFPCILDYFQDLVWEVVGNLASSWP
jgi:hypothetical protein